MKIWRDVVSAELHSGRGSTPEPASRRRTRWWVLLLTCGHKAERHVRYRKTSPPLPKGTRRASDDLLPAPTRMSCAPCTREALREILSSLDSGQANR